MAGSAQSKTSEDDALYEDLRTIQGKLTILNHPTLGRTEGRNLHFILKRQGCRKCFLSVASDSDGNYSVTVAKGKYRIISRGPAVTNGENFDWISAKQQRIVDASTRDQLILFDIDIVIPPD